MPLLALVRGWYRVGSGTELFRQGGAAGTLFLLRRGWAKHQCTLPDGRTLLLDFALPGEIGDISALMASAHDHALITLTDADVGAISADTLFAAMAERPQMGALLWWLALQQVEVMRRRVVSTNSRTARQRMCSLLWDLHQRLLRVGLATESSFHLPIRQRDLADAAGLTPVHTSRTLRTLDREGVVHMGRDSVRILDQPALEREAGLHGKALFLDKLPVGFPWQIFSNTQTTMYFGNTEIETVDI